MNCIYTRGQVKSSGDGIPAGIPRQHPSPTPPTLQPTRYTDTHLPVSRYVARPIVSQIAVVTCPYPTPAHRTHCCFACAQAFGVIQTTAAFISMAYALGRPDAVHPPSLVHLDARMPHSTLQPTPPFPPFTLGCNASFSRRTPAHFHNARAPPLSTRHHSALLPSFARTHVARPSARIGFPPSHSLPSLIAGI